MEHADILSQTNCLSLTDAVNDALGAIHFRILCDSPVIEKELFDSLNRCWQELTAYFPNESINLDIDNFFNMSVYPFSTAGTVTEWESWKPTVFQYGSIMTGAHNLSEEEFGERFEPSRFLATLYREQFVFRASLFITDNIEHPHTAQEMLRNFLLNADIPGVCLLSAEVEGIAKTVLPLDQIIPDNMDSFSRQPIQSLPNNPPMAGDWNTIGLSRDDLYDAINAGHAIFIPFIAKDTAGNCQAMDQITVRSENNLFDYLEIGAAYPIAEQGLSQSMLLANPEQSMLWPIWQLGLNGRTLSILRTVFLPRVKTVSELFDVARSYPVSSRFEERYGIEYMLLIAESDISVLPSLVAAGFFLERDVTPAGRVRFSMGLESDEHDDAAMMFEGSEADAESYLQKIIDESIENNSVFSFNSALEIAENMGCSPGGFETLKNEYYISQR